MFGLLAAALSDGLAGPGDGEFFAISLSEEGGTTASEPARYILVAGTGMVVGALAGIMMHLAGARVDPRRRIGVTVVAAWSVAPRE